jgi:hypothetical protein
MKKLIVVIMILTEIIFGGGCEQRQNEKGKKIADSIRVMDSLAMVQAYRQRVDDSIAKSRTYEPKIYKKTNDMTDESYYFFVDSKNDSAITMLSDDGGINGFSLMPVFKPKKSKIDIVVTMYKDRRTVCCENGFMVIKFKDGTKIKLKSWREFNCDGEFYFWITNYKKELSTKPIDKIMVENGRDFTDETHFIVNPNYFIEFFKAVNDYSEKK